MKLIGLLDCNNFFVSCERLFRPDLLCKPVVVLSSNDGCVVARSEEIKKIGITMGAPHFQIKKQLEDADATVFSGNLTLYRDISSRVMTVLRREASQVEPYSIDESFFSIEAKTVDEAYQIIKGIKEKVEKEVGVPVSIGVAKTKTIAKYASEKEKRKSGLCVLIDDDWWKETNDIPVHAIWGVGSKTSSKLLSHGVKSVADFLAVDNARVEQLFGVVGKRLQAELSQTMIHTLSSEHDLQKSIMSTRSFKKDTNNKVTLLDALGHHVSSVAEELRDKNAQAQCLRIMVLPSRHGDWFMRGGVKEVVLSKPTEDTRVFLKEAERLLEELYELDVPYKKVGAVLSMISSTEFKQETLFESPETQETTTGVMSVMDAINKKFGRNKMTLGRYKKEEQWQTNREHLSPRYTTHWNEIATIKL